MKFACEQCQTKYNLPDERVRGKVLKIRCKKCGCQITVSQGGVRTAKGEVESEDATMIGSRASVAAMTAGRVGGGGGPSHGSDDGDGGDSTMIGGVADFFDKIGAGEKAASPQQPDEWHLSVDGNIVDPMPLAELAQRVVSEQATPGREIYVWREGQAEWRPPDSVPEVRAAVEKARLSPAPAKAVAKAAAKPAAKAAAPDLGDDDDEGGDKTQMGSLDFAALGLDAKAAWEEPAKPAPDKAEAAKAGAKAAAKAEPLKTAAKEPAKAEPLKSGAKDAAKEPAKAGAKEPAKAELGKPAAKAEPLKAAAKEPLTAAAKEPAKSAAKEAAVVKPAATADADELMDDDAVESVDAIEMDIEMPAPPPKGSRPAPPKPPALKPPPSTPKPPAPAPAAVVAAAAPALQEVPAPVVPAPVSPEPPAPAPEPVAAAPAAPPMITESPGSGGWAASDVPPGEWPQEEAPAYPQAPAGDGGYGGPGLSGMASGGTGGGSPYGGTPYGGTPYGGADPMAMGAAASEAPSATPAPKSKTPIFIGIAAVVAVLAGGSYFLLFKPPTAATVAVVDAGQDAGPPPKPAEEPVKKPDPPKITGITKAEFDELWSAGAAPVTSCFEKLLKKQGELDGKELTVSVEISDKGKVGEIAFAALELDDKSKKCIQKAMKKWKFPAKDKSAYTAKFPLKIAK